MLPLMANKDDYIAACFRTEPGSVVGGPAGGRVHRGRAGLCWSQVQEGGGRRGLLRHHLQRSRGNGRTWRQACRTEAHL